MLAYAYGKSEKRTTIVDGGARPPLAEGHVGGLHQRIITRATSAGRMYERNQVLLMGKAYDRVG
jgi:hypothetical protein